MKRRTIVRTNHLELAKSTSEGVARAKHALITRRFRVDDVAAGAALSTAEMLAIDEVVSEGLGRERLPGELREALPDCVDRECAEWDKGWRSSRINAARVLKSRKRSPWHAKALAARILSSSEEFTTPYGRMMRPSRGGYLFVLRGREVVEAPNFFEFSKWFEKSWPARRVKQTTLEDGSCISTVFLGHNHNFFGNGPPLLFESMAFDAAGGAHDQERCSTWEEAEALHEEMIARIKALGGTR